jgi:spoIIIJ-associated protein
MPKLYEAKTLEEAYEKASTSLQCSIVDLEIEVVQYPTNGFFGMFSKKAIVKAEQKKLSKNDENYTSKYKHNKHHKKDLKVETLSTKLNSFKNKDEKDIPISHNLKVQTKQIKKEKIFNDFYESTDTIKESEVVIKKDNKELISQIHKEVNELFSKLFYEIDEIKVDILDDDKTVYIEFSGKDSALLIGKEGYRYKALSYILFNWLNEKYGMMLRLEVAQFLSNQEEAIHNYLGPVIQSINEEGYYKTKVLDGILVHITLSKLREEFPNKYVAVKVNQKGEKYILVNEYRN